VRGLLRHLAPRNDILRALRNLGSEEDIQGIANFLREIGTVREYELLAYHRFGEAKYQQLGRTYPFIGVKPPGTEKMRLLRSVAKRTLKI